MLRTQNDKSFSCHEYRVVCAVSCRSVIAVRVSGGHLCEAEAPTEPAGETAVRCAAIRPLLKGRRILSCLALRMTSLLVIANTCGVRLYFRLPVIASDKPFYIFLKILTCLFCFLQFSITYFVPCDSPSQNANTSSA